jgi:hypothetical protein
MDRSTTRHEGRQRQGEARQAPAERNLQAGPDTMCHSNKEFPDP